MHFVQYICTLESGPLADYVLMRSVCALILNCRVSCILILTKLIGIGVRVVQFKGNRARNFKSASRYVQGKFLLLLLLLLNNSHIILNKRHSVPSH